MLDLVVEDQAEVNHLAVAQEQQEQQILAVVAVEVITLHLVRVRLVVLVVQE